MKLPDFLLFCLQEPALFFAIFSYGKKTNSLGNDHLPNEESVSLSKSVLSNGFVKANVKDEDVQLIKKMGNRFNKLLKNEKFYIPSDPKRANTKAFGKYIFSFKGDWKLYFPEVKKIVENSMGDLFRSYFGTDYEVFGVEMRRNKYLPPDFSSKDAYSNFWHFDWRRRETSWLLMTFHLNDHLDCESFHALDLEISTKALKKNLHGRYAADSLPFELKDAQVIRTGGVAGSSYIANVADILHRAGDPKEGKDRDVAFVFVGVNVPWSTKNGYIKSTPHVTATDQSVEYKYV